MRFGVVHRVMTDALAALGILALVTSGELGRWTNVAIVVALAAALAVPEGWQHRPAIRHVATVGPIAMIALQGARLFAGAPILETVVEFAVALQIVRLATRRGAAHDQQVIVLALLHLVAGTVLGGGLGYGLCFFGFLVVAPGALALSHLRREVEGNYRQGARDRTGLPVDVPRILRSRRVVGRTFLTVTCLLSIPIFVFTGVLFVLFPRVGLSLLLLSRNRSGHMIGFSDHVDLGRVGTLRSDPALALRVEIPDLGPSPPLRIALHLRGAAFDSYDGHAWSRSSTERRLAGRDMEVVRIERAPDRARDRLLRVDLEPIDPPVLFLPNGAVALQLRARGEPVLGSPVQVYAGPEGEFRYSGADERGVRYDVWTRMEPGRAEADLGAADRARYLAVPGHLAPRIADLARGVTKEAAGSWAKARAVEAYLRREYRYDLSSPAGKAADPLDDFLFESRRGHCEFYSTAMVVLLRHAGVPARNVTGFIGGTYNRFGRYYAVRQGDAHSWVEVFVEGRGWTTFDPTPPSDAEPKIEAAGLVALLRDMIEAMGQRWDRYVVGYNLQQQLTLFQSMQSRYGKLRRSVSTQTRFGRKGAVIATALAAAALGVAVWLARRRRAKSDEATRTKEPTARERQIATALYEALEAAMGAQGVPRGASTPPWRHAVAIEESGHPLGGEIVDLTRIYLESRFGGVPVSEEGRRAYEVRVRRVRSARHAARKVADLRPAPAELETCR